MEIPEGMGVTDKITSVLMDIFQNYTICNFIYKYFITLLLLVTSSLGNAPRYHLYKVRVWSNNKQWLILEKLAYLAWEDITQPVSQATGQNILEKAKLAIIKKTVSSYNSATNWPANYICNIKQSCNCLPFETNSSLTLMMSIIQWQLKSDLQKTVLL